MLFHQKKKNINHKIAYLISNNKTQLNPTICIIVVKWNVKDSV